MEPTTDDATGGMNMPRGRRFEIQGNQVEAGLDSAETRTVRVTATNPIKKQT